MLLIKCPYCGERDQSEFTNGGEAHVTRPKNPEQVTDREWAEYVFIRSNPKGIYYERWVHTHGCKKWFNAVRNTSTDEILLTYKIGETPPPIKKFQNTLKIPKYAKIFNFFPNFPNFGAKFSHVFWGFQSFCTDFSERA